VPRYKLSLCHTPIKPDLLGFSGIGVFALGLRDHVITRFASLVPLSPKQVYDDQMKLKRKCKDGKSENSREDNGERRPSDLAKPKPKSLIKPVESGGKTRGVKKVSLCDDNSVEKLKK